jgi:hydroxymethylpyrimidine pyrophosphatase-like HAD family hydrolase
MMFTSSAQGSTPGVPGAHTASLAPEQADSISEIFADGLGNGFVARWLAKRYAIPTSQIATIGDMPNDVLMFAHCGLSIAMGNASPEVQRAARRVTTSNEAEGFANAVERFVLRTATR